jgi:hypothetical protein
VWNVPLEQIAIRNLLDAAMIATGASSEIVGIALVDEEILSIGGVDMDQCLPSTSSRVHDQRAIVQTGSIEKRSLHNSEHPSRHIIRPQHHRPMSTNNLRRH